MGNFGGDGGKFKLPLALVSLSNCTSINRRIGSRSGRDGNISNCDMSRKGCNCFKIDGRAISSSRFSMRTKRTRLQFFLYLQSYRLRSEFAPSQTHPAKT